MDGGLYVEQQARISHSPDPTRMVEVFHANIHVVDQVFRSSKSSETATGLRAFNKVGRLDAIEDRVLTALNVERCELQCSPAHTDPCQYLYDAVTFKPLRRFA